jgi:hypothetical protein
MVVTVSSSIRYRSHEDLVTESDVVESLEDASVLPEIRRGEPTLPRSFMSQFVHIF